MGRSVRVNSSMWTFRGTKFDQAPQVGQQDGVREVVHIVEHDDHLGQLGHLGGELFQHWRTQPAAVLRAPLPIWQHRARPNAGKTHPLWVTTTVRSDPQADG